MPNFYETCRGLFAGYPLAVAGDPLADETANDSGRIVQSMLLMLQHGDDAKFFVLSHYSGEGKPFCLLYPWPTGDIVVIKADERAAVPNEIRKAVTRGVPIPPEGSLFGWNDEGIITALTIFYTFYTQDTPLPGFTSMLLAGLPQAQWPPYTEESQFGRWFWDNHNAGKIVPLADLIGETADTVYWVDTTATLGSYCCAVARDVRSPDGPTLRRGRYVYYQALRERKAVPSLRVLLADSHKDDLAQRFQLSM